MSHIKKFTVLLALSFVFGACAEQKGRKKDSPKASANKHKQPKKDPAKAKARQDDED